MALVGDPISSVASLLRIASKDTRIITWNSFFPNTLARQLAMHHPHLLSTHFTWAHHRETQMTFPSIHHVRLLPTGRLELPKSGRTRDASNARSV